MSPFAHPFLSPRLGQWLRPWIGPLGRLGAVAVEAADASGGVRSRPARRSGTAVVRSGLAAARVGQSAPAPGAEGSGLARVPAIKQPKAQSAADCVRLQQLPNVGPAMARDLQQLGIRSPQQLVGADPLLLYRRLEALTGTRQDPCVLDTFMAVTDFMSGAPARPWWAYTEARRQRYGL